MQRPVMDDEGDSYPEDAPPEFQGENKIGSCWMSQFKLALRIGRSEKQVQRLIQKFKKDGVLLIRQWRDHNNSLYDEYQIVEKVLDAYQRPSQSRGVECPKRSKP